MKLVDSVLPWDKNIELLDLSMKAKGPEEDKVYAVEPKHRY